MTKLQGSFVSGAVLFAAIAGAFFLAVADGDQAADAAPLPPQRVLMGAGPAPVSLEQADREALFDRAKREARTEELPPQF